jgi:DM4/DM12 family
MFKCVLILQILFFTLSEARVKRTLAFPPTAPTRNQLIVGIGVPFESGEDVDVISGWVLKAEYNLPINSSDFKPVYFPGIFGENGIAPLRKRREVSERYDGEITVLNVTHDEGAEKEDEFDDGGEDYRYDDEEIEMQEHHPSMTTAKQNPFDPDKARWVAYKTMETMVHSKGYQGKACVLRAICEAADASFTHSSGLLGEMLHIIMS